MNFKSIKSSLKHLKFSCDITKIFQIEGIVLGHGGSNNIILIVTDKHDNNLAVKIIPDFTYVNVKKKPNKDQLEIKYYQFLTKKYIITDRTPHIVGIFEHKICDPIDKFLNKIKPNKQICPSYEDKLTKKIDYDHINNTICDLLLRYEMKLINPTFDVLLLEYCPGELSEMMVEYMTTIKKTKGKKSDAVLFEFIYQLHRILFQIIFTLAIIKDDYPGFLHGDLFVRNILLSSEIKYQKTDYVAYHYKQRIFYFPANGLYTKINDFGQTLIADELVPNTYEMKKNLNKYMRINPFDPKTDIFNLLHDIYDGQNLGTNCIMKLASELKLSIVQTNKIRDFLGQFIQINDIDKINKNNQFLLDETWYIDGIKILERSVLTPHQYLTGKQFEIFQQLPLDSSVVKHYNSPQR